MRDLLRRLLDALPQVERWIDLLHAAHVRESVAVSELGFARLADHFPAAVLERARVVTVAQIPFPPVAEYRLPEFEAMAKTPMAGITFGDMYFVRQDAGESVHFHELVHVVQWRTLGIPEFLLTYAVGLVKHGYAESPLEAIAFDLQARFERRERPGLVDDRVARHAAATRDRVAAVFRAHGFDLDGRSARK
jgi:hypothetical protein